MAEVKTAQPLPPESRVRLALALAALGIARGDVTRAAGLTQPMFAHWSAGRRRVSPTAAAAIARLVGERTFALLSGRD